MWRNQNKIHFQENKIPIDKLLKKGMNRFWLNCCNIKLKIKDWRMKLAN